MKSRAQNKILALVMAASMLFTLLPGVTVYAEDSGALGTSGVITSFEPLAGDIATQSVPLGTSLETLTLPETLTAVVTITTGAEPAAETEDETAPADNDGQTTDAEDGGERGTATPAESGGQEEASGGTMTVTGEIPATWQSSPEYDGEIEGTYIFTPVISDEYTLEVGVALPVITVTVEEGGEAAQAITLAIAEDEYGETALYLPRGVAIAEADLLAGVSAQDENGNSVPVTITDMDGLDTQNPQMKSEGYPNPPYIISYMAAHPDNAEVTAIQTREVYVTLGAEDMMPMNLNTDLEVGTWTGYGHRWVEFGGILWRVLEVKDNDSEAGGNKTALLLAENSVGNRQFHTTSNMGDGNWINSDIRAWLNSTDSYNGASDGFLNGTFTSEERDAIVTSDYTLGGDYDHSAYSYGKDTQDSSKVFLLSVDEANNTSHFADYNDRNIGDFWWLRSPGSDPDNAAVVEYNGDVHAAGYSLYNIIAIRPALKVNLTSNIFASSEIYYGAEITVEDVQNNEVSGARVTLSGAAASGTAFSNSDGKAIFNALPSGDYTLTAEKAGYEIQIKSITIGEGSTSHAVIMAKGGSLTDRIYFGEYNGQSILWRVLDIDRDSGTAFLLSDSYVKRNKAFDENSNGNWTESDIRTWLNGDGASQFLESFRTAETAAIPITENYTLGGTYDHGFYGRNTADSTQVFLLSVEEARTYLPDDTMRSLSDDWWLRSPGFYTYNAAVVGSAGYVFADGYTVNGHGTAIRPAFKLNLSTVIFTSAAAGGKSTAVGGSLSAAAPPTGEIKLTVIDDGQNLDVYGLTGGAGTDTLEFSYNDLTVTTGTNQYISCVLEDSGGEVKYYGKLEDLTGGSGDGSFNLPLSGVPNGTYTLKLFSEQANDDNYTDFCSDPVTMTVKVSSGTGTVLSNDARLVLVAGESITAGGEAGNQANPKTASISVANSKASIESSDIAVATGAAAQMYSDSGFNTQETSISLTEGVDTHVYIKVTSQDQTATLYYDVTVSRAAGATVPGTPQNLTATPGDAEITITWQAPANDGGAAITGYEIQLDSGGWSVPSGSMTHTFTGLTNGTQYTLSVRAVNSKGAGAEASTTATPSAETPPSATPTSLSLDLYNNKTATLTISLGTSGGLPVADKAEISISNSAIADISAYEVTTGGALTVTAKKTGSATITVEYSNNNFPVATPSSITVTVSDSTPPTIYHTVTFDLAGGTRTGGGELVQSVLHGGAATAPTVTRSGYTFNGWDKDFSNVTADMTVIAQWTANGNGNGGGSSSSDSDTPPPITISTEKKPDQPTVASTDVQANVDKNGHATYTITDAMVKALIEEAQAKAKSAGKTADGIGVKINVLFGSTATSVTVTIEDKAVQRMNSTSDLKLFSIVNPLVNFSFDRTAIKQLKTQTSGTVAITAKPEEKLSGAAQAVIGSRPVFDITISYTKNGKPEPVTDFKGGTVTLGIAYTPKSGEKTGNLYAVYVPDSGKPELLTESSYTGGRVIFSRSTLSVYGVGYKTPAPAFTDTANHWAKDNIDFVASRGLLTGTGETTFSPNTAITRGMFVTALGRLSGQDMSGYTTSSFSDVAADSYYLPYIEWAVKNKIVSGVGDGKFEPDRAITREEMAVMMVNYASAAKYDLPITREAVTFADSLQISSWAKDAVKALQQAGIVSGVGAGRFNPKGTATRAEAATILRNFTELVIDPGTARGWVKNDAGQQMYYTWDGRRVTGWLTTTSGSKYWFDGNGIMQAGKWVQIGGKWYYFYTNGKLAVNTTIDGYEVGADGARKERP